MMKYTLSRKKPTSPFIDITIEMDRINQRILYLQLPYWRPGRYEPGNFSANIRAFKVNAPDGKLLKYVKISRNRWKVFTGNHTDIRISYQYFAARPDAGSCWLTPDVFYVNPIHCCLYAEGRRNEKCEIRIAPNENLQIATALKPAGPCHFMADDYDQLVDSPILASGFLHHDSFTFKNTVYHIWIHGDCQPDFQKIKKDFYGFTVQQIEMMGSIPASEYHYLILALPFHFYHGVEHLNSTVLALGPASDLMNDSLYPELIGVASHELFHVWNVKTLRPAEMVPYDYTRENYSTFGWVYEGITTYYGDLFLARSGFFTHEEYFAQFSIRLQKHLDNPGRFNYSIAQSSFDTWIDGYVAGIPGRKTSIYDEGSLIAFILDMMIRKNSDRFSLDDFMRSLYQQTSQGKRGYTKKDIRKAITSLAGTKTAAEFFKIIQTPMDYLALITEGMRYLGLQVELSQNPLLHERKAGFRTDSSTPYPKVTGIIDGSPADIAGLMTGDEILEMNERGNQMDLRVLTYKRSRVLTLLTSDENSFYPKVSIRKMKTISEKQQQAFDGWITGKR